MATPYQNGFPNDSAYVAELETAKADFTEALLELWHLHTFTAITAIDPYTDVYHGGERSAENTPPADNVAMGQQLFGSSSGACVPTYLYEVHAIRDGGSRPAQMVWDQCAYWRHITGGGSASDTSIDCECNFEEVQSSVETFATQEANVILGRTKRCYPDESMSRIDTAIEGYEGFAKSLGAATGEGGGHTHIETRLANIREKTEDWNGAAGDAFTQNILTPLGYVHLYQRDIAIGLQRTAVAKKATVEAARLNTINIVRAATAKCAERVQAKVPARPKDGWRVISIAGTVTGLTAGFTLSGALSLVSALEGWDVAATDSVTYKQEAEAPINIIEHMTQDFDLADTENSDAEAAIEEGLRAIVSAKSELSTADLQLTDHDNSDWW
ncbi:hypothetical protein [Glycomyces arizonensis]|uniref:hypothetical protein n=1 Tax=Glycomyces arizonensis TaxID=256035 RepID=UPI00040D69A8|nr:hypothetical protein [Glycomyces arizonensis]